MAWVVLPITATSGGDESIPHELGRVPLAAIPVTNSGGTMRLQPALYDSTDVFFAASDPGLTGLLFVWDPGGSSLV